MKKVIISICILLCVAALIAIGYYYINDKNEKRNNPEDVFTSYFEALKNKDYEKMYSYISEKSKETMKNQVLQNKNQQDVKEYFIQRNKNIYEGIEASDIQVNVKQVLELNSEKTQIKYETSMNTGAGKISFSNLVNLLKSEDDKKYYIDWSSKIIYPELENTDKIRVNTIQPLRGQLLDRNGVVLAKRKINSLIGLVPGNMSNTKDEDIKKVAELLSVSVDEINEKLNASYVKSNTFVPIKTISSENKDTINGLVQINGIEIRDEEQREYPLGEQLAHLIGYVQGITKEELDANAGKGYTANSIIGKSGLESVYEDKLKGTQGFEIYVVDASENKKHTIVKREKKDGPDIKLTIDSNLQSNIYEDYKTDKSATVVINPKTGEILALVSTPSYNSNDFINGMSNEKWNSLVNNANNPLYSRFQSTWAPGSSFKPVVGAIGLTTNRFTAEENFGKTRFKLAKRFFLGEF